MKKLERTYQNLTPTDFDACFKQAQVAQIEYIDLSYNKTLIEHLIIPKGLESVRYLYLYDNKIQRITFEAPLPNLEILHLGKNQLRRFVLPDGFEKLEHLRLDNNLLEHFSVKNLNVFQHLKSLFLYDGSNDSNDLRNISEEFWKKYGNVADKVSSYLYSSFKSGVVLNNEAKVIWFGNGEAGKTTLSHQLRVGKFDDSFDRTHGIQIKDWRLLQKDFPHTLRTKMENAIAEEQKRGHDADLTLPDEITLKMWDFGGQELQHSTHEFFLYTLFRHIEFPHLLNHGKLLLT